MLDWALWYCRQGLQVFPVHRIRDGRGCSCGNPGCSSPGKHPVTSNGVRGASSDERLARDRWGLHSKANIGIHTNKLIVLDVDGAAGVRSLDSLASVDVPHGFEPRRKLLSRCPRVRTGGRGAHYFFKPNPDFKVLNKVKFMPGLDIRSEGGYVVAPPSNHVSGDMYTWVAGLQGGSVPIFPGWLKDEILKREARAFTAANGASSNIDLREIGNISEGGRNHGLTRVCGRLFFEGRSDSEIWAAMKVVNAMSCKPPVSEGELIRICKNIKKKEMRKTR